MLHLSTTLLAFPPFYALFRRFPQESGGFSTATLAQAAAGMRRLPSRLLTARLRFW
jgi:hypothetical protein